MKRFSVVAVVLAVTFSTSLWAQAAKPAARPAAKPAAPQAVPAKPAPQQQAEAKTSGSKSRRNQDARHCLSQPGNTAIIKCAEAYL
jgi:hypothetical protein